MPELALPLLLMLPLPPEDAFPPPEPAVPPADVSVPDVVLPFPVPSVVAEPVLELLLADAPLAKHMISPVAEMEHPIWFILSLFVSLLKRVSVNGHSIPTRGKTHPV